MQKNPLGMNGIAFVEFSSPEPEALSDLFTKLGFTLSFQNPEKSIDIFTQNSIVFILNSEPASFARKFSSIHGPSIPAMGWVFENPASAQEKALSRGTRAASSKDYDFPAVEGIGKSLIYFCPASLQWENLGFKRIEGSPAHSKGFLRVDHLTNNVEKGTLSELAMFYQKIFGFTEVRYFDIKGKKTGLQSFALRSPCGCFCIPINEAQEKKSQINEYLERYHGSGIQHLALATDDILASLDQLETTGIEMLDIDEKYYETVFNRVPNVTESRDRIRRHQVLIDGDAQGYLLQIFTKDLIGPIFFEIIQRKNHQSFGEGNFQALFDSIERDQERRGVFR
jgi:4-hydroxyphenylpyruvate dioxygenase